MGTSNMKNLRNWRTNGVVVFDHNNISNSGEIIKVLRIMMGFTTGNYYHANNNWNTEKRKN